MSTAPGSRLLGSAVLLAASAALAQDNAGTATLGTARAGATLLSYDELAQCLKQRDELGRRRPQLEAERTGLERERSELQQLDESLKTERAEVDRLGQVAADINRRAKVLDQQVVEFNERVAKFDAAPPTGPAGERERRSLERERAALDKAASELQAERAALGPDAEQRVKAYQARVMRRDAAAAEWNSRNASLVRTVNAYQSELATWQADCEGRRYREDDEKAIKAAK